MLSKSIDVSSKVAMLTLSGSIVLASACWTPAFSQGAAPVDVPQGEVKPPKKEGEPKVVREKVSAPQKIDSEADAAARKAIEKLGSSEFDEREAAIEKLHDLGKGAIPALKDAAANDSNPEVRWNARRVLRDLTEGKFTLQDAVKAKPRARVKTKAGARAGANDFGIAIPEFEGLMLDDLDAATGEELEKAMRRQMESLERSIKELHERIQSGVAQGQPGLGMSGGGHSSSVEIVNENGHVKVTVKEKNADGVEEVNTYEAPSMEEFRQKYPDVAKKYFDGGAGFPGAIRMRRLAPGVKIDMDQDFDEDSDEMFGLNFDGATGGMRIVPGGALRTPEDMARIIGPDNGERLGVGVKPIDPGIARFLGIDKGTGFQVENVAPNSMAEAMGVKANDIVISVDGKVVGKDSTVREALAGVPAGKSLRVEVIRGAEGRKVLEGEKRAPAEAKRAER